MVGIGSLIGTLDVSGSTSKSEVVDFRGLL